MSKLINTRVDVRIDTAGNRLYMMAEGKSVSVPFSSESTLMSKAGRAALRIAEEMLERELGR